MAPPKVFIMLEGYEWDEAPLTEAQSVVALKREIRKKLAPKILPDQRLKALERLDIRLAMEEISEDSYNDSLGILCGYIDIDLKAVKKVDDYTSEKLDEVKAIAKPLEPHASLVSVLQTFEVSGVENMTDMDAVRELFTKNIWLFAYLPKGKKRPAEEELLRTFKKHWIVNGQLSPWPSNYYYVDPVEDNDELLQKIYKNEFVAFHGPRTSGKSTRILRTMQILMDNDIFCHYISLHNIRLNNKKVDFWNDMGREIGCRDKEDNIILPESGQQFRNLFRTDAWTLPAVIFIDEFDRLYGATDEIRYDFLGIFREVKQNIRLQTDPGKSEIKQQYVIKSVVACGTFGILHLNSSNISDSPFNVREPLPNRNFTKEQVESLFKMFMKNENFSMGQQIIDDIYSLTNGHPSMVSLCGIMIEESLAMALDDKRRFQLITWQNYVVSKLILKAATYPTFERVVTSLVNHAKKAKSKGERHAVDLLRLRFLGNSEPQKYIDNRSDTPFYRYLAAEGVIKPLNKDATEFEISSPLMRSMLIRQVLPNVYKSVPNSDFPLHYDDSLNIVLGLKTLVKIFDQNLLRDATKQAFKISKVLVKGAYRAVPSEHVYHQELSRILSNWITSLGFNVTGQFHQKSPRNKDQYLDIVLIPPTTWTWQKPVILELLSTATVDELKENFDRAISYRNYFFAAVGDLWVVHFTCEDDYLSHPLWQTKRQLNQGLNVIHFWHNTSFTTVKACWCDQNGVKNEILEL